MLHRSRILQQDLESEFGLEQMSWGSIINLHFYPSFVNAAHSHNRGLRPFSTPNVWLFITCRLTFTLKFMYIIMPYYLTRASACIHYIHTQTQGETDCHFFGTRSWRQQAERGGDPWFFCQLDLPGRWPGGILFSAWTTSTGCFWCTGATARLWAPSRCLSPPPPHISKAYARHPGEETHVSRCVHELILPVSTQSSGPGEGWNADRPGSRKLCLPAQFPLKHNRPLQHPPDRSQMQ